MEQGPDFQGKVTNEKMIDKDSQDTKEWIAKMEEHKETAPVKTGKTTAASAVDDVEDEWNDLEKQRDIAFKIMYFFIVFIIATFSLLYAFFRMTKKQEQEAAMRKGVKRQMPRDQQESAMTKISIACVGEAIEYFLRL